MADTCDINATNNAEETRSDALGMLITSDLFRLFFSLWVRLSSGTYVRTYVRTFAMTSPREHGSAENRSIT